MKLPKKGKFMEDNYHDLIDSIERFRISYDSLNDEEKQEFEREIKNSLTGFDEKTQKLYIALLLTVKSNLNTMQSIQVMDKFNAETLKIVRDSDSGMLPVQLLISEDGEIIDFSIIPCDNKKIIENFEIENNNTESSVNILFEQNLENNTYINQNKFNPDCTEILLKNWLVLQYFINHYIKDCEISKTIITTSSILSLSCLGDIGKEKQEYLEKADLSRKKFLLLGNISKSNLIKLIEDNWDKEFMFKGNAEINYQSESYSNFFIIMNPDMKVICLKNSGCNVKVNVSENVSGNVSENVSGNVSDNISDAISDDISSNSQRNHSQDEQIDAKPKMQTYKDILAILSETGTQYSDCGGMIYHSELLKTLDKFDYPEAYKVIKSSNIKDLNILLDRLVNVDTKLRKSCRSDNWRKLVVLPALEWIKKAETLQELSEAIGLYCGEGYNTWSGRIYPIKAIELFNNINVEIILEIYEDSSERLQYDFRERMEKIQEILDVHSSENFRILITGIENSNKSSDDFDEKPLIIDDY